MLAYRVRERNEKKNVTREIRATKKYTRRIKKNHRIPRWGRVQMTQAERTRTMKYVLRLTQPAVHLLSRAGLLSTRVELV